MANFKVGQRVRVVAFDTPDAAHCVGHEGQIVATGRWWEWRVRMTTCAPHLPNDALPGDIWEFHSRHLEPLTDPKADEERWARVKVRQVTRPQPVYLQGDLETRVPHPLANEGVPCWP